MSQKYCEDCGGRVYSLGCVNCDEDAYIAAQQAELEASEFYDYLYQAPIEKTEEDEAVS